MHRPRPQLLPAAPFRTFPLAAPATPPRRSWPPLDPRKAHLLAHKTSTSGQPVKIPQPLPTVPRKRILRSACIIAGTVPDSYTDGHLNIPPFKKRPIFDGLKKRPVVHQSDDDRLKNRFKSWQQLCFADEHEEVEVETECTSFRSTRAYRTSEHQISKALTGGQWRKHKKHKALYVHIPSGRVLVRADFVEAVTDDGPSSPPPRAN
jgi:hypothetical protein